MKLGVQCSDRSWQPHAPCLCPLPPTRSACRSRCFRRRRLCFRMSLEEVLWAVELLSLQGKGQLRWSTQDPSVCLEALGQLDPYFTRTQAASDPTQMAAQQTSTHMLTHVLGTVSIA